MQNSPFQVSVFAVFSHCLAFKSVVCAEELTLPYRPAHSPVREMCYVTCLSHYPYFPSLMIIAYVPVVLLKTLVSSQENNLLKFFLELIKVVHSSFSNMQINEKMAHPIMWYFIEFRGFILFILQYLWSGLFSTAWFSFTVHEPHLFTNVTEPINVAWFSLGF